MSSKNKKTLFIFSFLLISQFLLAQTSDGLLSKDKEMQIDQIFKNFDNPKWPGAAVSIVKDGQVVFKGGYGSANLEYDIPVRSNTVFHVASVSKQFTVLAILLLEDEGKLSFDDDIRKYIPEVPGFGTTITLRHLAGHTSGLRDHWDLYCLAGGRMDDAITNSHLFKLIERQEELNFTPGEKYWYSNTGYTLLAEVVARVSGQSFSEFTLNHIFEPLGMINSQFYDNHEKIVPNRAYSYEPIGDDFKKRVLSFSITGSTSLFTTIDDIGKWILNFESAKVGNREIFDKMETLAQLNNGSTFTGAYGLFVNKHNGHKQVFHEGSDAGYRAYLSRFPDERLGIAVFSTSTATDSEGLALEIANIFLENKVEIITEQPLDKAEFISLSTEKLSTFEGYYWNQPRSLNRKIYILNDTLRYSRGNGNETPLAPISENTFKMMGLSADVQVEFAVQDDDKGMEVIINNENTLVFEKYIPSNYSEAELNEFVGSYYSDELDCYYRIQLKSGNLILHRSRLADIQLKPFQTGLFLADLWYLKEVKFVRGENNRINGLKVSGERVSELYFTKK